MGTNYYCKKIDKKSRDELKVKIVDLFKEVIDSIDKPYHSYIDILKNFIYENRESNNEIHLGKRSYGWQFLWDYHNGIYYEPTLESIKKFLSQEDLVIYNEYGEIFTPDQLFNDELSCCLYKDEHHSDGSDDDSITRWHDYYFTNDGLRFSKFEDFS